MKPRRLILFFWTLLILAHGVQEPVWADIKEIEERIQTQRESLDQVKKDIHERKNILRDFDRKERGLLSQLQSMDQKLALKEEQLESYDQTLTNVQEDKGQLESEIQDLQADLSKFQGYLSFKVVQLYKHGGYSYVKALFSAGSYSGLLKRYRYLQIVAQRDRANIETYREVYLSLKSKQEALAEREGKILSLQKAFEEKNQEILAKRKERAQLLDSIRKEKVNQKQVLDELELSARSLQETLEDLMQRKEAMFGDFEEFKGRLPWPVHGEVVTEYGKRKHEKFNTYVFSKGIDIGAKQGAQVKAVHNGRVLFADWFKGYGRMLILDHGEGFYSLYAHLSKILVPMNQAVEKGQAVGNVGETGSLKGPVLYFEIRYHGEPQDPLTWLSRRPGLGFR